MNTAVQEFSERKGEAMRPLLVGDDERNLGGEEDYAWPNANNRSQSPRAANRMRKTWANFRITRLALPVLYIMLGMFLNWAFLSSDSPVPGLVASASGKAAPASDSSNVSTTLDGAVSNLRPLDYDQVAPAKKDCKIGMVSVMWGTGRRMNMLDGFKPEEGPGLFNRSLQLSEKYARRWGYPFWLGRDPFLTGPQDGGRTGMWTKEALVLSVLLDEIRRPQGERLEWIYYIDADAILANHNVPLETFFPPNNEFYGNTSLLVGKDQWGSLDAGAFFVRVSEDGIRLMSMLLAYPFAKDSEGVRMNQGEQSSMGALTKNKHLQERIVIVPQHWFNSDVLGTYYPDVFHHISYKPGDLMIHFMSHRKGGWPELLEQATYQQNSTMSAPLDQTRYMKGDDTVAKFWTKWEALSHDERVKQISEAAGSAD